MSKKQIFKISLILILGLSIFLCIYTTWEYSNNIISHQKATEHFMPPMDSRSQMDKNQFPNLNPMQPVHPQGRKMSNMNMSSIFKYTLPIGIYSMIFLFLFITYYYFFIHKNTKVRLDNEMRLVIILLCIGLFFRISLTTLIEGHPGDINLFKSWATSAANDLFKFYKNTTSCDYPPFYIYILFLIGKVVSILALENYYTILLKLPSIIADIVTAFLIYKLAKKHLSPTIAIFTSTFYAFNPAVFTNSAIWGQVDSFFTLLVVVALLFLSQKKYVLSSTAFTGAVLMKPQGIVFLPVLFFELIREKNLKTYIKVILSALVTAVVIILPFSSNGDVLWIFRLFLSTISEYPYASVNAFNFFGLLGANYVKDTSVLFIFNYHTWGMIFIVTITLLSWFIYAKANSNLYVFAIAVVQIAGVFTFSTSMHERYLFPAIALAVLAFVYLKDKRFLVLAGGFTATVFVNTYYVLLQTLKGINNIPYNFLLVVISLLNIALFIYLIKILLDSTIKNKTPATTVNDIIP
ncbi:conserved hypothetical protein [Thermoanaerobacter mathranii subsp. mathranii str. A3]|uniref:Glycosyltransferase RgtA/B/C/D-like domain-containing protein n=1 Tax=Thermoanaerobacter mathranii subsp. mathranii (strain DSM 11426 / CCUG 53645 / CIP 108742 / A3) TaxID=583358 RepID=A0ABM5LPN1_THEM3|nr:glycosyltransferase family 39 protein [Thermoanaerobacter mathranii]ADH60684.1 conserved hypothetical protein [Thermoanaerobacter mathranii subsp. mathranii str. A3]